MDGPIPRPIESRRRKEDWSRTPFARSSIASARERLRVGDPIPSEAGLAAELGVSRTVVREAFRASLRSELSTLGNGRRARVGTIDNDVLALVLDHAVHTDQITIQQIYDVRRTIEMRTVALAALRRDSRPTRSRPRRRDAQPFRARTR